MADKEHISTVRREAAKVRWAKAREHANLRHAIQGWTVRALRPIMAEHGVHITRVVPSNKWSDYRAYRFDIDTRGGFDITATDLATLIQKLLGLGVDVRQHFPKLWDIEPIMPVKPFEGLGL